MIEVTDLKNLKEKNEKVIAENEAIIEKAKSENADLSAENRVFDKLIKLYEPEEIV